VETRASDRAWLADWRRRIAELYADVRAFATESPEFAWNHWREVREQLFREHPQSPVPQADRFGFRARHWPYDPDVRWELAIEPAAAPDDRAGLPSLPSLPVSAGEIRPAEHVGWLSLPLAGGSQRVALHWLGGYADGLFLAIRDATNGVETYGAGRYVLDTAKATDLGGDPERGTLTIDLNFAYHPSCAFDPRWACPLAPPENRLAVPIRAGERLR
jgi:uncharacterized protein (DUF1684 family)